MACSTCDDYQLVDSDGDGVYDAPCPDCRSNVVKCRVHGVTLRNGRCSSCKREARIVTVMFNVRHEERQRVAEAVAA